MSQLLKGLIVLLSLSLMVASTSGCAKKGKKRAGPPASTGATTTPAESPDVPDDGSDEPPFELDGDGNMIPKKEEAGFDIVPDRDSGNTEDTGVANQCGKSYETNNPLFSPGLPYPATERPYCTGARVEDKEILKSCDDVGSSHIYTDSRKDDLMYLVTGRLNELPDLPRARSLKLAQDVRNLRLSADIYNTGNIKLQFAVLKNGGFDTFLLKGKFNNWKGKTSSTAKLAAVKAGGRTFRATITCADLQFGCQNAIVRLDEMRGNKIRAVAYVIHRWGDAHLTLSKKDMKGAEGKDHPGYAKIADMLSSTAINTCLNVLADVKSGRRQLPECAHSRLQELCGGQQPRANGAKIFDFRSWATAYGRSGFEFAIYTEAQDGLYDFQSAQEARLKIVGPLVYSQPREGKAMWSERLTVQGKSKDLLARVALAANDGGGNLNLQLVFDKDSKVFTRVSLTTLFEDTRFNADRLKSDADQTPALDASEFEQEDAQAAPVDQIEDWEPGDDPIDPVAPPQEFGRPGDRD